LTIPKHKRKRATSPDSIAGLPVRRGLRCAQRRGIPTARNSIERADQGIGALIQRDDHEVLLQDHEAVALDADRGVAKTESRGRHKAEPPIEVRVSEQNDCRLLAAMCLVQTAADELRPDASSLVIRTDPHRTENHQRAVPDPRSVELHVANDPSITFGNEGEGTLFVADGSDRFDYVLYRVAVPRLQEGEGLDTQRIVPVPW